MLVVPIKTEIDFEALEKKYNVLGSFVNDKEFC
jgi:hypothetical protein